MCFCAEASFTVGAVLIPLGGYCLWSALAKRPAMLGLAAVPLFFGVQQISEGFVWLGLNSNPPEETRSASLVFLFFALAFWPLWFPLFGTMMETHPMRRRILAGVSVLALGWFWFFYFPLLAEPSLLTTHSVHHSVQYDYHDLAIYRYVPRVLLRVLYFLSLAAPFLIGSERGGWLPGLMLAVSTLIAAVVFDYAFVSVWCFFAAVLAGYICTVFYRLPYGHLEQTG